MPRFFHFAVLSVAFLLLCQQAAALELNQLNLKLTRDAADNILSKDYEYRVLEDVSVRRTWKEQNREVCADFAVKNGKALFISIAYTKPVTKVLANRDAEALIGAEPGTWREMKPKMAARLGMKKGEGMKLADGSYLFRELGARGRVTRMDCYPKMPKENRLTMEDYDMKGAVTAMGTRASAGVAESLLKDEARRRATEALASAPSPKKPAPAPVAAPRPAKQPVAAAAEDGEEEALEESTPWDEVKARLAEVEPTYYGIAAGVVILLLMLRALLRGRAEKRRRAAAEYILQGHNVRSRNKEE